MKQLMLNPTIYKYDECKIFCKKFRIGKDDLIITNKIIYDNYLKYNVNEAAVLFKENYGGGEPSDKMIQAMHENVKRISYERVIAIGGGSILDIAKLFALKSILPVEALCNHKLEIIKEKELILVPATCGTGSEVTNFVTLHLREERVKSVVASDELYADSIVIIPELLKHLPDDIFIYSSINALINSMESYLSIKATSYTKIFSLKAIELIINGYKKIYKEGIEARSDMLEDFLIASNYSGIACSNTRMGMIHSTYTTMDTRGLLSIDKAKCIEFANVFEAYGKLKSNEEFKGLNQLLSRLLECDEQKVYEETEKLLNNLVERMKSNIYNFENCN